jgi:hypothetical protein
MFFLFAILVFLLLPVLLYLFVRGGAIRESPKPRLADVEIGPRQQIQSEARSTVSFEL